VKMPKYSMIYMTVLAVALVACVDEGKANKSSQAAKAKEAANSITFKENAEIDNIKNRLELTSQPGLLGYIVLLNESGQPVYYSGVKGKITSGSKRLTEPDRSGAWGAGQNNVVRAAPSDEGTYGSSGEYIFFWTTNGQYVQWNGKYFYSDKPIRLTVQPLVVNVETK
jgi:hypothetical protein